MGKAFKISDCSSVENPRLGRYPKMSGSHAPQMKNSKTIMRNSLKRMALFIGWEDTRKTTGALQEPHFGS
jgi:hypothetical protein